MKWAAFLLALSCAAETVRFQVSKEAEVVATLELEAPGADWAVKGREAAVAVLHVDGGERHHVITWGGPYRVSLGRLKPGAHELSIERDNQHSRTPLRVGAVRFEEHTTPEYAFAPVLYARADTIGAFSDIPMVMYVERVDGALQYTVIFSNEDGGTNTRALMARWGRTTDIEYLYRVSPETRRAIVQGKDHVDAEFTGPYEDSHSVLIPFTRNNMVKGATERTALKFRLAPVVIENLGGSRERVMDSHPNTYAVMTKELVREGKLRSFGIVDGDKISDPRNYLYIEYEAKHRQSALTVGVQMRDGRTFNSDLGRIDYAIARDGYVQTTVELPPKTRREDIAALSFMCIVPAPQKGQSLAAAGECELQRVFKVFLLGEDGKPGTQFATHGTPHKLATGTGVVFKP